MTEFNRKLLAIAQLLGLLSFPAIAADCHPIPRIGTGQADGDHLAFDGRALQDAFAS